MTTLTAPLIEHTAVGGQCGGLTLAILLSALPCDCIHVSRMYWGNVKHALHLSKHLLQHPDTLNTVQADTCSTYASLPCVLTITVSEMSLPGEQELHGSLRPTVKRILEDWRNADNPKL